jgi:hypothetical protein
MIAFACVAMVVTYSLSGFYAIIIASLFELKFVFAKTPIVQDNNLRLQVSCQPGIMK